MQNITLHITLCPCISHTYLDLIRVLHGSDIYRTVKQKMSTVNAVLTTALLNDASLIRCKVHWVFCIQLILLSFQNTHTHTHTCGDSLINLSGIICHIPVCATKHMTESFLCCFHFFSSSDKQIHQLYTGNHYLFLILEIQLVYQRSHCDFCF